MTTLLEFIEQRLTEDELWAKAASAPKWPEEGQGPVAGGVHWTWATGDNWDPVDPDPLEPYMGGYDGQWSQPVTLRSVEEWPSRSVGSLPLHIADSDELRTADGAHIVRHDPARVLREVQAKRRTLARHYRDERGDCVGCGFTGDLDEGRTEADEHCPELLDMASVWSDHAQYLTEWSPS